jgi:tripartite-type tricarboxylate transporter receptor subunit TctC
MNSICRSSRRTWCAALALTLSAWGLAAQAQAPYPQRPITFVVPNAAGGAADNLARSFAEALGKQLGQSVVVENLGGASGSLAAQKVLRAAPDGYTLLFGTTSDMVVAPIAIKSVGYSAKDFTPIAKVGSTPMTLVARSNLGVSNAEQLVALAKQKPGGLTVGTTGNASLQAFATVALQRAEDRLAGCSLQRRCAADERPAGRTDRPGCGGTARHHFPGAGRQAHHVGCAVRQAFSPGR